MDPSSYAVEQSLGGNPAQPGKRKTKIYIVMQKKKKRNLAMSWHEVSDADYRKKIQNLSLLSFHDYNDNPELQLLLCLFVFWE